MESLLTAGRDAWRYLRSNRGFALTATLIIAVGVGPMTAIFTAINGVLVRPLPYDDAERLVRLVERVDPRAPSGVRRRVGDGAMELAEVAAVRVRTRSLSHIAPYEVTTTTLTMNSDSASLESARVSGALFEMLRVQARLGRFIQSDDEKAGGAAVVVLSHGLWQRRFGGRRDVLGEIVSIDARDHQVVGVMPAGFQFPPESPAQMWLPFVPLANEYRNYRPVIARVAAGRTLPEVEKELGSLVTQYRRSLNGAASSAAVLLSGAPPPPPPPPRRAPGDSPAPTPPRQAAPPPLPLNPAEFAVLTVHDQLVGPIRPALEMLATGAMLLLLVACANFAGLTLASAWARQQEFAVRTALGAHPRTLATQILTENVMVALAGAALGAGIAAAVMQVLRVLGAITPRRDLELAAGIPRSADLYLDLPGIMVAIVTAVVVSTMCGFAPAWSSAARQTFERLRASMASAPSGFQLSDRRPLQAILVVVQVAMGVMLLVGAALFTRTLIGLATTEPGYDVQNVLTFQVRPARLQSGQSPLVNQADAARLLAEYDRMAAQIRSLPGVIAVGYSQALPMTRTLSVIILRMTADPPRNRQLTPPDFSGPLPPETPNVRAVSSLFLDALGARTVAGRRLNEGDHEQAPRVMLINRTLAESGFIWQQPLGRQIYAVGRQPWEIVGIIEDIRRFGVDQIPDPQIYINLRQAPELLLGGAAMTFAVRAHDPASLTPLILKALRHLDPDVTLDRVETTAHLMSASLSRSQLYAALLTAFAVVAISLAALGVYAMLTYAVARRSREIGIRLVLGARTADVCTVVLGQVLTFVLIGLGAGLAGGLVATRGVRAMLYGVSPTDPWTYLAVSILLLVVAVCAALVPLRRALGVDPAVTLRAE